MIQAADHGLDPRATPEQNAVALGRAMRTAGGGDAILIPRGRTYRVAAAKGLGPAVLVDRGVTWRVDGKLVLVAGGRRANPPFLFDVVADNVTFEGDGIIAGSGAPDDDNVDAEETFPGLLRVSGDNLRVLGITLASPPKLGIFLIKCHGATISATWRGGVGAYRRGHTALFGVRATGGGWHQFVGNNIVRDEAGARLITAYFAGGLHGGTEGDLLRDNVAEVHEKLAYLYGRNHHIADCRIMDANQTDAIRLYGGGNVVERVQFDRCKGAVSAYDVDRLTISGCVMRGIAQAGIYVECARNRPSSGEGIVITDNHVWGAGAPDTQDGIYLDASPAGYGRVVITGNRVAGFGGAQGTAALRVIGGPDARGADWRLSPNSLTPGPGPATVVRDVPLDLAP